jgi:hypothetical protein
MFTRCGKRWNALDGVSTRGRPKSKNASELLAGDGKNQSIA